jgi:hypothetical protein
MSKYNKSTIFKSAWNLVKTSAVNFSKALKQAWANAKSPKPTLADLNIALEDLKILTDLNSVYVKETEKAICYKVGIQEEFYNKYTKDINTSINVQNLWIPKSAIIELENGTRVLASWFANKIGRLSFICR